MTIYTLPYPCGVEFSNKGSNGCHLRKARLLEWIEHSLALKRIYVNKTNVIQKRLKILSLALISSWLCGRILDWHLSQPGFDPSFENLACLVTLMSCDTMKQYVCGWQYVYIFTNTDRVRSKLPRFHLTRSLGNFWLQRVESLAFHWLKVLPKVKKFRIQKKKERKNISYFTYQVIRHFYASKH